MKVYAPLFLYTLAAAVLCLLSFAVVSYATKNIFGFSAAVNVVILFAAVYVPVAILLKKKILPELARLKSIAKSSNE